MSSDFYPSSLSRNIVRTGTFGYRENSGLRVHIKTAQYTTEQSDPASGSPMNFMALSDSSNMVEAGPKSGYFGETRLRPLAVLSGRYAFTGPFAH